MNGSNPAAATRPNVGAVVHSSQRTSNDPPSSGETRSSFKTARHNFSEWGEEAGWGLSANSEKVEEEEKEGKEGG